MPRKEDSAFTKYNCFQNIIKITNSWDKDVNGNFGVDNLSVNLARDLTRYLVYRLVEHITRESRNRMGGENDVPLKTASREL